MVSLLAQTPPRPSPPPTAQVAENPLKPFEWLLEGPWYTEGEFPGMGKYTGMRMYRHTLGGKFIEMQQEMLIQPAGAGATRMAAVSLLGRHPGTRRMHSWGFARDGSISISEWDVVSPVALRFEGRVISGTPWRLRGILRRPRTDEFVETIEVFRDGGWRPHSESRFSRRGVPLPPDGIGPGGPAENLKLVAPLAGTWTQQAEYGVEKLAIQLAFRWVLSYSFLRSEYVILRAGATAAKPHAISFIGYNAEEQRIVQYGFSEDATVFTAGVTLEGNALVFEGEQVRASQARHFGEVQAGGSRRKLRVIYRRTDADTLVTSTEAFHDGAWQKLGEASMKRKN